MTIMTKEKEPKWRKWADHKPMSDEDHRETCMVMAKCLPAIIERHEYENNG